MAAKYPEDAESQSVQHCSEEGKHLSGYTMGQEVNPECEVIFEGESGPRLLPNYDSCEKNPGHATFIPVPEFTMDHLPEELRNEETMKSIQRRVDATVRIRVNYTSVNRPDTFSDGKAPYPFSKFRGKGGRIARYGTGTVGRLLTPEPVKNKKCPCPECKMSGDPKTEHWLMTVQTSTHVIYDDSEADWATFDCFYDHDDIIGEGNMLYGVCMEGTFTSYEKMYTTDLCSIICITHESDLVSKLTGHIFSSSLPYGIMNLGTRADPPAEIIVSHPHGCGKRITIGKIHHVTVPVCSEYNKNGPLMMPFNTICHVPLISQCADEAVVETNESEEVTLEKNAGSKCTKGSNDLSLSRPKTEDILTKEANVVIGTGDDINTPAAAESCKSIDGHKNQTEPSFNTVISEEAHCKTQYGNDARVTDRIITSSRNEASEKDDESHKDKQNSDDIVIVVPIDKTTNNLQGYMFIVPHNNSVSDANANPLSGKDMLNSIYQNISDVIAKDQIDILLTKDGAIDSEDNKTIHIVSLMEDTTCHFQMYLVTAYNNSTTSPNTSQIPLSENDILKVTSHITGGAKSLQLVDLRAKNCDLNDSGETSSEYKEPEIPYNDADGNRIEDKSFPSNDRETNQSDSLSIVESIENYESKDQKGSSGKTIKELLEELLEEYENCIPFFSSEFGTYHGFPKMLEAIKGLLTQSISGQINEFDMIRALLPTANDHFNCAQELTDEQSLTTENFEDVKPELVRCFAKLYEALGFTADGIETILNITKGIIPKMIDSFYSDNQQLLWEEIFTQMFENPSIVDAVQYKCKIPLENSAENKYAMEEREMEKMLAGLDPTSRACFEKFFSLGNLEDLSEEIYLQLEKSPDTMSWNVKPGTDIKLPDGLTFTLPPEAEYTMRFFSEKQGRFMFHPGTTFHTLDGEPVPLPDEAEFENGTFIPSKSYATYNTDTCPGSSGAAVYCDLLGNELTTFFPHSGGLRNINRSGIIDNKYYSMPHCFSNALKRTADKLDCKENITE